MTEPINSEYDEQSEVLTEDYAADDAVEVDDIEVSDEVGDVEVDIVSAEVPVVFIDRPIQTVGRRKEAVVRVRLLPAPATSRSTGSRSRSTSRTSCTSS